MDVSDLPKELVSSVCAPLPHSGANVRPSSSERSFDTKKLPESAKVYRRIQPNFITGPSRHISSAKEEDIQERAEKWKWVAVKLDVRQKMDWHDLGETLTVGFNPTPYDGWCWLDIPPGEAVEVPKWVVDFVDLNCKKHVWRSVELSTDEIARQAGVGSGSVSRYGIGYTNTLQRVGVEPTHILRPV
jgi:hypothetical protein